MNAQGERKNSSENTASYSGPVSKFQTRLPKFKFQVQIAIN